MATFTIEKVAGSYIIKAEGQAVLSLTKRCQATALVVAATQALSVEICSGPAQPGQTSYNERVALGRTVDS